MPNDKATAALLAGRRAGHEAAMLFWNGASNRDITRRKLALAMEHSLPERACFMREYKFWKERAIARIHASDSVKCEAAVQGEHAVVFYEDECFIFFRYEKLAFHDRSASTVVDRIADMLATLKHCSPEAYNVITA